MEGLEQFSLLCHGAADVTGFSGKTSVSESPLAAPCSLPCEFSSVFRRGASCKPDLRAPQLTTTKR